MVKMKAYTKTIYRSIKSNLGRIISIVFIILIGITCYSGLGTLTTEVKSSFNNYYNESFLSDLNVKTTSETGFSEEEILKFENDETIDEVDAFTSLEFDNYEDNTRLYIFNKDDHDLNKLEIVSGRDIEDPLTEILVEQPSSTIKTIPLNSTLKINLLGLFTFEAKVVGTVKSPLNISQDGDINLQTQETLYVMIYSYFDLLENNLPSILLSQIPTTDLYISFKKDAEVDYFSKNYQELIDDQKYRLSLLFNEENYVYLSLYENKSYSILNSYCDKVDIIAILVPIFFLVVAALVVLTTMTRMIDEDRASIGCYASLGVPNYKIKLKYMFICGVFTFLGSVLGMILGLTILPSIIYPGFETLAFMPPRAYHFDVVPGIIATLVVTIITMSITFYAISKDLRTSPANLLLPKSPKAGKKILLERITFIWKRLPFRYKSSLRNIFRNKKHFWMTVLSCAGSTVIVFLGFSLLDVVNYSADIGIEGLADTMVPISILIIFLAILLTIFVIYNLTNMNIGERTREIATLGVLGYRDREICMYIYREISLMGAVGIILGIPLGALATYVLLNYLDFGSISDVRWYTYFLSGALVVLFIVIVDMLLIRKILRIDMTTSLKSVD